MMMSVIVACFLQQPGESVDTIREEQWSVMEEICNIVAGISMPELLSIISLDYERLHSLLMKR